MASCSCCADVLHFKCVAWTCVYYIVCDIRKLLFDFVRHNGESRNFCRNFLYRTQENERQGNRDAKRAKNEWKRVGNECCCCHLNVLLKDSKWNCGTGIQCKKENKSKINKITSPSKNYWGHRKFFICNFTAWDSIAAQLSANNQRLFYRYYFPSRKSAKHARNFAFEATKHSQKTIRHSLRNARDDLDLKKV